jgi:hypothetical protein
MKEEENSRLKNLNQLLLEQIKKLKEEKLETSTHEENHISQSKEENATSMIRGNHVIVDIMVAAGGIDLHV